MDEKCPFELFSHKYLWGRLIQVPGASVLRFSFAKGKLLLQLLGTPYLVERNLPGKMKFGLQYAYKLASLQQNEVIYIFLWDSLQK